jgi:rubrerythrin
MGRIRHRSELLPPPERRVAAMGAASAGLEIDTREELINALQVAAELEHALLNQYLFAAFSVKRRSTEGLTHAQVELVRGWQRSIFRVARDEMAHLATVSHLLSAVGGRPYFMRANFPQAAGTRFPFKFKLERLTESCLERFVRFERPTTLPAAVAATIAPEPIEFDYTGELYRSIRAGIERLAERYGRQGRSFFIGHQALLEDTDWTPDIRVPGVRDVASAMTAIEAIILQGEGAPEDRKGSHFQVFVAILDALRKAREVDPTFEPARAVVDTPLTRAHPESASGYTLLKKGTETHACAELFNHVYGTMLLLLTQFFDYGGEFPAQRELLQASSRRAMSAIVRPIAEILTELPVEEDAGGPFAGPGFEIYGELRVPSNPEARWILIAERVEVETEEARGLSGGKAEPLKRMAFVARNLELLGQSLTGAAALGV